MRWAAAVPLLAFGVAATVETDCADLLSSVKRRVNLYRVKGNITIAGLPPPDAVTHVISKTGYFEWRHPDDIFRAAGLQPPPDRQLDADTEASGSVGGGRAGATRPLLLDVGSNIGYFSVLFALHGYSVLAIEPLTQNRRALAATLCLNPHLAGRIHIVATALGAPGSVGPCLVASSRANPGNGVLKCGRAATERNCSQLLSQGFAVCESVPFTTLDQALDAAPPHLLRPHGRAGGAGAPRSPRRFDMVKMDVEGHECNVLKGAARLFDEHRPSLLHIEAKPSVEPCVQAEAKRRKYNVAAVTGKPPQLRDRNLLLSDTVTDAAAGGRCLGLGLGQCVS